jgi:hypothetical protein
MKSKLLQVSLLPVLLFLSASVAWSQDAQVQALRQSLAGQKFLVTYRDGGAVYGTYNFLQVHLCRSGNYFIIGQSRKQTVMNNQQINNWRDQGVWDVVNIAGQVGVKYVSASGGVKFYPTRILPDGSIQAGNGITVIWKGTAQCR